MAVAYDENELVSGPVERSVRASIAPGDVLRTPTGRGEFSVERYTSDRIVLLLGAKQARTPLPWRALEEVPDLLRGRGWVLVGCTFSTDSTDGTLDAHLKSYLKRATASWVAVVLERGGVVELDRVPPAKVRLKTT